MFLLTFMAIAIDLVGFVEGQMAITIMVGIVCFIFIQFSQFSF
jgi:hypothetical protein